jgi:hypothetical protein
MDHERCFIISCGHAGVESLTHPDRGLVDACEYHARRVREIQALKFPSQGVSL